ncbi:hypothetical protein ETAA8_51220 [Anatilimnocola aggregata]|uniref:Uncharacterized protein n=1 Tax=Anatilimnocola aggregata TaxID=2528021 RepID=A0A517YIG8_9BACT|nr:hypothetical protein [Anatilimnocola aggregata]QDU30004.1 hypothetical protein ETAA8_51220 [Anatilimnocola aggregata]
MAKSKQQRGKGNVSKNAASDRAAAPLTDETNAESQAKSDQPTDPLRAYRADPPRQNLPLLIVSVGLFVIWFGYLAYVALRG